MLALKNKNIVIGVTGSIAAYKVLGIAKSLRKLKAKIYVIMTEHSTKLVDPEDFEKASGNKVHTDLFEKNIDYRYYLKNNQPIKHINLADTADLLLICPATANIIGKIANGFADDLLTTTIMATSASVIICPAMNVNMWKNKIMQQNISKLKKSGYIIIGPEYGTLACGYEGFGRLSNPNIIIEKVKYILTKKTDLKGKKILITAGATIEEMDPVRIITNKSSGKMGTYIAEEAFLRGADVTLIRGINSIDPSYPLKDIKVSSSKELFDTIKKHLKPNEMVIHSAAVSDFTVKKKINYKIKSGKPLNLELSPTTKILEKIKKAQKNVFLVGFKAEYNVSKKLLIKRAYELLKKANADLIIANDVGKKNAGFNSETNEVFIVDKNKKVIHLPLDSKRNIASKILGLVRK